MTLRQCSFFGTLTAGQSSGKQKFNDKRCKQRLLWHSFIEDNFRNVPCSFLVREDIYKLSLLCQSWTGKFQMALERNRISRRAWMQSFSETLSAGRLSKTRELCFQLEIHPVASSNYLYSNRMSFLFLFECNLPSLICTSYSYEITAYMRNLPSFHVFTHCVAHAYHKPAIR